MSNVSRVLGANADNDKCLVFFDKSSVDSLFGAGLIKYICENITDVAETTDCFSLNTFDDNFDLTDYKNVTFVGCYPNKEQMAGLVKLFGDCLLFITCNEDDYNYIRKYAKGASIEYSKNDSCAMNLYKIAFGEFEDNIHDVIKILSAGVLKHFEDGKLYNNYLSFVLGFYSEELEADFPTFYSTYIEKICEGLDIEEVTTNIESLIAIGDEIINSYLETLNLNFKDITSDPYKVAVYNKAFLVFSNVAIGESVVCDELTDANIIINVYKENGNYWGIELIKVDHTDYLETEIQITNNRITELQTLINNSETSLNDKTKYAKELKDKTSKLIELNYILDFDCGAYLEKYYKGLGIESHGYAKITNKQFAKLLEAKSL